MIFFGVLYVSQDANALGPEGHAIVADIAATHLKPSAKAEIARLLQLEGHSNLDQISSWPDEIRKQFPATASGHFVDIPLKSMGYMEDRDCHYDQNGKHVDDLTCVVVKLPSFVKILSDKTQTDANRLEALKWVVHLVGDIHQPLHTEDNNHDLGGNLVKLTYNGVETNLHSVWDGGIIEMNYGWKLGPNFTFDHSAVSAAADVLDSQITDTDRDTWAPAGLIEKLEVLIPSWANKTHSLAQTAYAKLPQTRDDGWDKTYQSYAWPVMQNQLSIAGVRLTQILNEALP